MNATNTNPETMPAPKPTPLVVPLRIYAVDDEALRNKERWASFPANFHEHGGVYEYEGRPAVIIGPASWPLFWNGQEWTEVGEMARFVFYEATPITTAEFRAMCARQNAPIEEPPA